MLTPIPKTFKSSSLTANLKRVRRKRIILYVDGLTPTIEACLDGQKFGLTLYSWCLYFECWWKLKLRKETFRGRIGTPDLQWCCRNVMEKVIQNCVLIRPALKFRLSNYSSHCWFITLKLSSEQKDQEAIIFDLLVPEGLDSELELVRIVASCSTSLKRRFAEAGSFIIFLSGMWGRLAWLGLLLVFKGIMVPQ